MVVKHIKRLEIKTIGGSKIAILENLQGIIKNDIIEIDFNPNMICPAPDRHFDGTYVISIVNLNKKRGGEFHFHTL